MGIRQKLFSPFGNPRINVSENQVYQGATSYMQKSAKENAHGKALQEPLYPDFWTLDVNPEYREKPDGYGTGDPRSVLQTYAATPLFQAILGTRTGQVSRFTNPISQSNDGMGFQVVLTDKHKKPTDWQKRIIQQAEHFIQYMGVDDPSDPEYKARDDFDSFCAKAVRDTYTFDQVTAEKVFDSTGKLHHISAVDPSTMYKLRNKHTGKLIPGSYAQVYNQVVINKFTDDNMIFAVRRPNSSIYYYGYGQSELQIALQEFVELKNTEMFNDRFFSHGGSVQGIINIKNSADGSGIGKSRRSLQDFRRNFERRVTGVLASWQLPVTTAEDIKYVNLTPNARDMEFEKWTNFLINMSSSVFNIDPAEIGFPNKSGATGSKGSSLNESNPKAKIQASMNRGLSTLLRFIEKIVNNKIIKPYFGNGYQFQFVGEDIAGDTDRVKLEEEQVKTYRTVNELRQEHGLQKIKGGDVLLNQFYIQRIGQIMQQDQIDYQRLQDKINLLNQSPQQDKNAGLSFQDMQSGLDGTSDDVSGKNKDVKNGQIANQTRTDKINFGGKKDE